MQPFSLKSLHTGFSPRFFALGFLLVGLFVSSPLLAQKTWLGTSWNTASNWSPTGVHTASDDVVIPNIRNSPAIVGYTASTKSLTVQTGTYLFISDTGRLNINGSTTLGISNEGTVYNLRRIEIGSTATTGIYGAHNKDFFGGYQAIRIDAARKVYHGASEMRKDGQAAGY